MKMSSVDKIVPDKGFTITCNKCGAEVEFVDGEQKNNDISISGTCYITVLMVCKCGNRGEG